MPEAGLDHGPPTFASNADGTTGANHHTWTSMLGWSLANFAQGWPQTEILSIAASPVVGITNMSHYTWPYYNSLKNPLLCYNICS
jgi:hypothetical protein